MLTRSFDNTLRGTFHVLELEDGEKDPLKYRGKRFPISLLNTYNLLVNPTQVLIRDTTDNNYYNVLHANSELQVLQNNQNIGQVKKGSPAVVGGNLNIQQSPAPFCYIDKTGALNSVVSSNAIWSESVMGYVADGKPNTYAQGFVRDGSATHGGLFLRKDGQWGQPAVWTGSVSENFLSLNDTPVDYNTHLDKYLRVSYANGGSVVFDAINTDKVPEGTQNIYYTNGKVNTAIDAKCADRSIPELKVQNTITCKELISDSDRKLKENVQSLKPSESLNSILKMKSYSYNFKGNEKIRTGFIADEVSNIFPTIATSKTVNYIDIIPHMACAIQELQAEVKCLQNKLFSSK